MGFMEALTLIFVVLKATGCLTWAWWQCFIPIMISFSFYLIILVIALIGLIISILKG